MAVENSSLVDGVVATSLFSVDGDGMVDVPGENEFDSPTGLAAPSAL